jgi:hypothetical protein
LAQECVSGLALHGETLFAVVSLERASERKGPKSERRRGKCLLLKSARTLGAGGLRGRRRRIASSN